MLIGVAAPTRGHWFNSARSSSGIAHIREHVLEQQIVKRVEERFMSAKIAA